MINYQTISEAIIFYQKFGYKYIEVPWLVSKRSIKTIYPNWTQAYKISGQEYLVGSTKQSFVEMMDRNEIPLGKYCACTPCFRREKSYTSGITERYFVKVELINIFQNGQADMLVAEIRDLARNFMSFYLETKIEKTDTGFDIKDTVLDLELGSYGYKEHGIHKCIYGTGLAEPRFSSALKYYKQKYSL